MIGTLIHALCCSQPERQVTWYWEPVGNAGKSFLADWLEIKRDAFVVTGGKFADIAYAFNYQEYIVFDFARDQQDRFPYQLLEDFKNRRIFSTKYASMMKRAVSCKLIVFANFEPERAKLSQDRWDIHRLNLDPFAVPIAPVQLVVVGMDGL